MKKGIIWFVVAVVAIFVVSMLVRSSSPVPPAPVTSTNNEGVVPPVVVTPEPGVPAPTAGVKEFTVAGSNFAFAPNTMTVKKGDTVKITFVNSGGFHDLKIDEFNVATKKINGGAQDIVTFVADKAGTFEYYCSIGTHRQMGMKGTLTVIE